MAEQEKTNSFFDSIKINPGFKNATRFLMPLRKKRVNLNMKDVEIPAGMSRFTEMNKAVKMIHEDKPHRFTWGTIIIFLLFSGIILGCMSVGGYIFLKSIRYQRVTGYVDCKEKLADLNDRGLDISAYSCETDSSWLNIISPDRNANTIMSAQRDYELYEKNTKEKIQQIQNTTAMYVNYLSFVDYDSQLTPPPQINGLGAGESLKLMESYKLNLEKAIEQQSKEVIQPLIETHQSIISQNRTAMNLSSQKNYIDSYSRLNDIDKVMSYPELKSKLEELIKTVKTELSKNSSLKSWEINYAVDPNVSTFKSFSPEEFKEVINSHQFSNTSPLLQSPTITTDAKADTRIIQIAEGRGYLLRAQANESTLISIEGNKLQPEAKSAWEKLKAAAKEDGISLQLISGYRSVSDQRTLFTSRLREAAIKENAKAYTASQIAAGDADDTINSVLSTSSIPGYSRHHNGYTIDINDSTNKQSFTEFAKTEGYKWISANNYYNAKRFGFLPSYPKGVENQGPEPEEWEYVWVGTDSLLK